MNNIKPFVTAFIIMLFSLSWKGCKPEVDKELQQEEEAIQNFIEENNIEIDTSTEEGLRYYQSREGQGEKVQNGDFIITHAMGKPLGEELLEEQIDSNFRFIVGRGHVMLGLDKGILFMSKGEKGRFIVPFRLAYYNPNASVPNYNTYHLQIEVVEIVEDSLEWELERIRSYVQEHEWDTVPDSTGFTFLSTKEGTGAEIDTNDVVKISYEAYLLDGTLTQSASQAGPLQFTVGEGDVIEGLEKAVALMKVGGQAKVVIPSSLAYEGHYYYSIPPFASIRYNLEVLDSF